MANDDDEIGYRKPPRAGRFPKGKSGNPNGRPKGAKNLDTLVGQTVNDTVQVTVNGKRRSMSKLEASLVQLVNKAASSGDPKYLRQLIDLVREAEGRQEARAEPAEPLGAADLELLHSIAARLDRMAKGPEDV